MRGRVVSSPCERLRIEQIGGQADALVLEVLGEGGSDTRRLETAHVLALLVDTHAEVEEEQVLQGDDLTLHALHLGDVSDAAGAVLETGDVDDQVDGRRHLLTDRSHREVEAGHEHHRLDTGEGVAWPVGVNRGQRVVVTGVHRLEHVQGLRATDLTDDDAVGTHTQGVPDQITDPHLTLALDVGGPGLQCEHVLLMELQLGGVLHGDDALVTGDVAGQHVQGGGLTGTGTTGDDDVEAATDAGPEEVGDPLGEGAELDEVGFLIKVDGELANSEVRPADRQGMDDGVDTGAVGETGVHHRRRLVDTPADLTDDLVDDAAEVDLVDEQIGRASG